MKCRDCDRAALTKGRCKYHYSRHRRSVRDADPSVPRCSNACGRASFVGGLCKPCSDGAAHRARTEAKRPFYRVSRVPLSVSRYCACGEVYYAKGKCLACYRRDKYASTRQPKPAPADCDCGSPHFAKGKCRSCYNRRWKKAARIRPVKVEPLRCACGQRVKSDGKCGTCLRKLSFRCADTGWRHEWVVRERVVYCRVCKYVKGPL